MAAVDEVLQGAGALCVSLADPGGEPILEPRPGAAPLWAEVIVTALFPADADSQALSRQLATTPEARDAAPRFSVLEERDWVREFRENLQPLRFGARLWICPADLPCPDPDGVVVRLDPGLAFGSGSHPTTALCLTWLAGLDLRDCAVLDWGCGSGVLAIAALALGARAATALDIDPQALQATAQNAQRNGLAAGLHIADPASLPTDGRHDILVANILADSLIALAPMLRRHCKAGARVALSGILAPQAARVCEGCAPWLDLHLASEASDWVLLAGTPV